jgi:heme exporter protein B
MSLGVRGRISTAPDPVHRLGTVACALAVAGKDLRIELRTREIVTTGGFFAALVAIMASVSFYGGDVTTTRIASGTIWLAVAFSSVLALGRTWQREREDSALLALLVSPAPRASIFLGKAIGVVAFMMVVEAVVVPVVALLFHIELGDFLGPLSIVLFLSTIGIAATGTLFGAMTVRTRARDLVLATVLFPLLSPTMVSGVAATREIFVGAPFEDVRDYLVLLGTFDFVAIAGGLALFGVLLDD